MPIVQALLGGAKSVSSTQLMLALDANNSSSYSGSGTTWYDLSGNGYNATLHNSPTFVSSGPKHFAFDRLSTQYASAPNIGNLSRWTIESWFRIDGSLTNTSATCVLTTVYYDAPAFYGQINYTISNYGETEGNTFLRTGFFNGSWNQTSGFTPSIGTWYHVIGTYDGQTLKHYVNSSLSNTFSTSGGSSANGSPIRIARRWDGAADEPLHFFPGSIGLIKIYRNAMTAGEVNQAFQTTRNIYGV
jgi:hypothetical protein